MCQSACATGVYGVRGTSVEPGVIENFRSRRRRGKLLRDYGWTPSRQIWLGYQLTEATVSSGVVTLPRALRDFIASEYDLVDQDGVPLGRLATRDASAWGLGPMISRRGLEAGDYVMLTLDFSERRALARSGPEPLWEDSTVLDNEP